MSTATGRRPCSRNHDFRRQDRAIFWSCPIDVGLSVVRAMDIRVHRRLLEEADEQVGDGGPGYVEGAVMLLDAVVSEHTPRGRAGPAGCCPAHAAVALERPCSRCPTTRSTALSLPPNTIRTIMNREQLENELGRRRCASGFRATPAAARTSSLLDRRRRPERQWPPGGRGERCRPVQPGARLDGPAGSGAADRDRAPHLRAMS